MAFHSVVAIAVLWALPGIALATSNVPVIEPGNITVVCPGDEVTLKCTATDPSTTALRWNSDTGVEKTFISADLPNSPSYVTLIYTFTLVSINPMVSTLKIAGVSNDTSIKCTQVVNSNLSSTTASITLAAAPGVVVANLSSCGLNAATLQWSASLFDRGSNFTGYTLTSNPPASNCNGSCAVDPATRLYTFSGLQPGVPYTLGVRGANCGGAQRGAQSVITLVIPSAQAASVCSVFDAATGNLMQLDTTWYPLRVNNSLLCGPVGTYNISYEGSDKTEVYPVSSASCSSNCNHLYSIGNRNSSQYKVSVTGYGVLSTSKNIGSINDILKVELVKWSQSAITCTFLSGLVGTSGCVVSFGTSPDQLLYTITSSQSGGSGQSVTIPLTINGAPVDLNTTVFYYKASLTSTSQCTSVTGQTGCPTDHLGSNTVPSPSCTTTCANWTTGLPIPNGCVCLSSIVNGSQATYICDEGYLLEGGGGGVRWCMSNGAWSGTPPTCSKATNSSGSTANGDAGQTSSTTVIVIVVIVGCGLILVLATGVVVSLVLYRRHSSDASKSEQDTVTSTKRISPVGSHTFSNQPSETVEKSTLHSSIQLPVSHPVNYTEVITLRVAAGGGTVVKIPAPVEDVQYSTLMNQSQEAKYNGRSVIDV